MGGMLKAQRDFTNIPIRVCRNEDLLRSCDIRS